MSDDFGRRLEAAAQDEYHRQCDMDGSSMNVQIAHMVRNIVRAANAQDSAPAFDAGIRSQASGLARSNDAAEHREACAASGAGVDLVETLRYWATLEDSAGCSLSPSRCRALLSHIEALERDAARWRYFRDEMDDSDKLHMLAHGTVHYDSDIDAARKEAK